MKITSRLFKGLRPFSSVVRNKPRLEITPIEVSDTDLVIVEEVGNKGIFTLNRPKALNAASLEMIHEIGTNLIKWRNTKSMVLIKGTGEKAFCAGGDLRAIIGDSTSEYGKKLFGTFYTVMNIIGNMKIPYVAFIDGITMGGGTGLSIHGRYRIATERTLFAMPETTIGLIPDVGGSYFLPRLPNKIGYYLGLTGSRLKGPDVLHAGIATHYCESAKVPEIEKALLNLENLNQIEDVINSFCPKPNTEFVLSKHLDQINESFSAPSIEEILSNLEKDNSEWAKGTIQTMRMNSPLSLKIALRILNMGANLSLGECLQQEYRLVINCLEVGDFREGCRARLISRDNPKWNPSRIEDVTEERVLSFFQLMPNNEDLPI